MGIILINNSQEHFRTKYTYDVCERAVFTVKQIFMIIISNNNKFYMQFP